MILKESWENNWVDYYKALNVTFGTDNETIKKSYYALARIYYVDQFKSEEAKRKLQALNEAYEILSNKEKKAKYDTAYVKRMPAVKKKSVPKKAKKKTLKKEIEHALDVLAKKIVRKKKTKTLSLPASSKAHAAKRKETSILDGILKVITIKKQDANKKKPTTKKKGIIVSKMAERRNAKREETRKLFNILDHNFTSLISIFDHLLYKTYKGELTALEYERQKEDIKERYYRYLTIAENNNSRAVALELEDEYNALYKTIGLTILQLEERDVTYYAAQSGIIIEHKQLDSSRQKLDESESTLARMQHSEAVGQKVSKMDYFNVRANRVEQMRRCAELEYYVEKMKNASSKEDQQAAYAGAYLSGVETNRDVIRKEFLRWGNDNSADAKVFCAKMHTRNEVDKINLHLIKTYMEGSNKERENGSSKERELKLVR